jgi:hypothetical protein
MAQHQGSFETLPPLFLQCVARELTRRKDAISLCMTCRNFREASLSGAPLFNSLVYCNKAHRCGGGVKGFARALGAISRFPRESLDIVVYAHTPEWEEALSVINECESTCSVSVEYDLHIHVPSIPLNGCKYITSLSSIHAMEFSGTLALTPSCRALRLGLGFPREPQPFVVELILRHAYVNMDDPNDFPSYNLDSLFPSLQFLHVGENTHIVHRACCPQSLKILVVDMLPDSIIGLEERMPGLSCIICPLLSTRHPQLIHSKVSMLVTSYEVSDFNVQPQFAAYRRCFPSLEYLWCHARLYNFPHGQTWVSVDDEPNPMVEPERVWNCMWLQDVTFLRHLYVHVDAPCHAYGSIGDHATLEHTQPVPCDNVHISAHIGHSNMETMFEQGVTLPLPHGLRWDSTFRSWLPRTLLTRICNACDVRDMPTHPPGW